MQRPSVDLPQPDSPTRPSDSPCGELEVDAVDGAQDIGRVRRRPPPTPPRSGKCISSPRTSSSGSATGDHRLAPRVRGAGLVVDAAVARPAPSGTSGNSPRPCSRSRRTRSAGGTRQPGGGAARSGGEPGIDASWPRTRSKSGTERSRPSVYGWRGSRKTASTGPVLDDLARVHHRDALARLGDDREVVRDEHER